MARYLASKLSAELAALHGAYPAYAVLLCGHSLGGGAAALTALLVADVLPALPLHAYCFGAPPVLSAELARGCKRLVTTVCLGDDVVPRLCYGSVRALKTRVLRVLRDCDRSYLKAVAELVRRQSLTQTALGLLRGALPPTPTPETSGVPQEEYLALAGDVYALGAVCHAAPCLTHFP